MKARRGLTAVGLALAVTLIAVYSTGCASQQAQYPSGPVTFAVGFPAGSGTDLTARSLTEATQKHLGQPLVVQNVPGAAGGLAAAQVAKAKPDGYTVLFATASIVVQPHFEEVAYDLFRDFDPVLQTTVYHSLMAVRGDSQFKTIKDVVDFAKKNPGKLNYSSSGFATLHHLLAEMLWNKAGATLTHVPFRSTAEGVTALMGGNVDISLVNLNDVFTHLQEGRLRPLGIFAPERFSEAANIPTFKEQGYDVTSTGWYVVTVPKGTPAPVVQKLHDAFKKGMADPPYTTTMAQTRFPITYRNAQDSLELMKREFAMYSDIAKVVKK